MKKIELILLFLLVLNIYVSGCIQKNNSADSITPESRFLGSWFDNVSNVMTFYEDGTVIYSSCGCERLWEMKNQTLLIFIPNDYGGKGKLLYESLYKFSDDNSTCTLTNLYDGSVTMYIKK
jgi:hypothetical protein